MSKEFNYEIPICFKYRLIFTQDVFDRNNGTLVQLLRGSRYSSDRPSPLRCVVFVDDGLSRSQPNLVKRIESYFADHQAELELRGEIRTVPGGEKIKQDFDLFQKVIQSLYASRVCRHSFVIVVGGGSVIDAVCFAASIVHRGIRQIRIPTTVLAQNDAGIGIKNGIDQFGQKNFLGTFSPPFAVINDIQFLKTLNPTHWISGVAEAVKVALLKDPEFFSWIARNAPSLRDRNLDKMALLVKKCADLHLQHIVNSGDPFEQGSARPLDFGHWIAHKLEALSDYAIPHGHAVATGIAVDLLYSRRMGFVTAALVDEVLMCLSDLGFDLWQPLLAQRNGRGLPNDSYEILKGLEEFREHLGGELHITLIRSVGECFQVHEIVPSEVIQAIENLRGISFKRSSLRAADLF